MGVILLLFFPDVRALLTRYKVAVERARAAVCATTDASISEQE